MAMFTVLRVDQSENELTVEVEQSEETVLIVSHTWLVLFLSDCAPHF